MTHSTHDAPPSGWAPAKLSRQSTSSPDLSPRVSASFAGMPLVSRDEATDASLTVRQHLTSSMTSLVSGPHSEITRRLARATCPPIPARSSPPLSKPKGEYKGSNATFSLYSRSKSSLRFGHQFGCLWNSSHASSFLSWSCFSSASFLQQSRSLRRASSFMPLNSGCIDASSFPVALTKKLSVSSAKVAAS